MSNAALKAIAENPFIGRMRDQYSYWRDTRRGTFAQHGEDLWLDNHFGDQKCGFYIDIGASHPIRLSNTYKLYSERGWCGVTVEPIPALAEAHRKWRPGDYLMQVCIGTEPGKRTFFEMSPSVLSTLDEATAREAIAAGTATLWRTYDIDVITLPQLFDECIRVNSNWEYVVDLLSVDMEGLDAAVLTGFAFDRFRPSVIIAEANNATTRARILAHLKGRCDYRLATELGCNLIFRER